MITFTSVFLNGVYTYCDKSLGSGKAVVLEVQCFEHVYLHVTL